MTKQQMARFTELMLRDLAVRDVRPIVNPIIPVSRPNTVDEFLDRMEQHQTEQIQLIKEKQHKDLNRLLGREELFRFAYVPFVIAELVWDYADTVMILARDIPAVKKLCRAIRNARTEYNYLRKQFIDEESREREIENMYVFEDGVARIVRQMLLNIDIDIKTEYPDLLPEYRDLLVAVYQCSVLSKALLKYNFRQASRIEKLVKHRIGNILPEPYYIMDKLIPEFVGDKPCSPRLKGLFEQYIQTLSVQMGLIELDDTPTPTSNYKFQKPPEK